MSSVKEPILEDSTDIAIIGISGRFPGAENIEAFWRNLRDGVESITQFSDEELLDAGVETDALQDPNYVKAGAILGDIEGFDAPFFGLLPREAEILDPQQRLFLEEAWKVIESAGYDPTSYDGAIGVFAGVGLSSYLLNNLYPNRELWESVGKLPIILANDKDSLTTRAAYFLDLTGPCCTVQTYCSTSLVAVNIACESLLSGESDMALAGGVLVLVPQKAGYYYQEGGIPSPDARCRAFDAKANGSPLGSGVAVVLLKRLEDAVADGDTIYAVIKGWATNNDGALRTGYTAPGVRGQARVILEALANADVSAESISYLEAHGTATALGDAVEFAALVKAFGEHTSKKGFCAVGSVKTNVGHLDRAAGATGLIKTALALKHKLIPPSLNYEEPNPEIDFSNTPFFVNTELREWTTSNGQPRRAGVSSFGMGGTNAHTILEEPPDISFDEPARPYQLLVLSAKTATALDAAVANLREHLCENPDINMADVAYTLQAGRHTFEHRRILVCRGRDDALQALDMGDKTRLLSSVQPSQERPVAFMFPGVGDHYVGMARELYQLEPVFRDQVDHCCNLLLPILGSDLRDVLYPAGIGTHTATGGIDLRQMLDQANMPHSAADERLGQTEIAQPAVFVIGYALARLLQAWGIVPDSLVGYSLGEYTAACVAGILSLEDALTLVTRRAQMIHHLPEGSMLAVSLSEAQVQPYLDGQICLAVVNGPTTCVLAGPPEEMTQLEQQLVAKEIACRRLETRHAFHSTMMEPIVAKFSALVHSIQLNAPQIPCLSNLTGDWITDDEATDPAYWTRHLCQTVRFGDNLARLLSNQKQILIEVGPGQSLGSFAKQHPDCSREQLPQILPTLRYTYDQQPDLAFLLGTLGKLWLTGFQIDWSSFHGEERRQRIPLPTYPFEHQRYWIEAPAGTTVASPRQKVETGKKADIADWFYEPVWEASLPPEVNGELGGSWLIFVDSLGWGATIGQRLRQQGASVVQVQVGETFARQADDTFVVQPDALADYHALMDALERSGGIPSRIVHTWSIGDAKGHLAGVEALEAAQRVGFYSLLYLAQAVGKRSTAQSMQITVLTNGMQPVENGLICPERATILGPCLVVPQEYPNIRCRAVDISLPINDDEAREALASQLVAELRSPMTDVAVAYRTGVRYVQRFVPRRLVAEPMVERLQPEGVYLITGGLGGIGLSLAKYLAQRLQARLILTSRSGLPERRTWDDWLRRHPDKDPTSSRIREIRSLESLGSKVLVMAADVSNKEQMQATVDQIYEQFGELNGVIHTAGLNKPDSFPPIQDTDQAICKAHFLPKVDGLYVLDEVLEGKDIGFCALFSSLSAVLGGLGFAAYAAANCFMDLYTHRHNYTHSPNWISVDWDTWRMNRQESELLMGATVAEFEMTPEEGVRAFALAVTSGATQLVNSTGDLDARIRQWVMLEALQAGKTSPQPSHSRPDLGTEYVPPSSEYQKRIAGIWQDVLGITPVGIHDNFFELGGHSLMAIQIMSQLRQVFKVHLALSVLLMTTTVAKLAIAVEMAIIEELESLAEDQVADLV
jgi:acyl transferase domain-containing protein/acyl carrier protein